MNRINKDELFQNLNGFLKSKGIELKEGSYAQGIQKGCSFLADVINLGQQGLERARTEMDTRVDELRQVIHEKTAPPHKPGPAPAAASAPPPIPKAAPKVRAKKTASRRTGKVKGR